MANEYAGALVWRATQAALGDGRDDAARINLLDEPAAGGKSTLINQIIRSHSPPGTVRAYFSIEHNMDVLCRCTSFGRI